MYTIQYYVSGEGLNQDFADSLAQVKAWLTKNRSCYNFDLDNVEVFLTPDNINVYELMKDA